MTMKHFRPMTPGTRGLVLISRVGLFRGKPYKPLTKGSATSGGRNQQGRITCRHRGGGHKRKYRTVDFVRRKWDVEAVVERIEYDPNRTAFIALLRYEDGEYRYILAPGRLEPGQRVLAGDQVEVRVGNAMPLKSMPLGTIVHNVELKPGAGGAMARSAGSYVQLAGRDYGYARLKLPSGELRLVKDACMATVGQVSNAEHQNEKLGKAGRVRWMDRRPHVRGVAMNPVDHPMGGGEGKASGGRHPVSPWGWKTKGKRTRRNLRTDPMIIRRRGAKRR